MTESDWLTCTDPQMMLAFLRDRGAGERKLRLFACACCRHIWDKLPEGPYRRLVEVTEQMADGHATADELAVATAAASHALAQWAVRGARMTLDGEPTAEAAAAYVAYYAGGYETVRVEALVRHASRAAGNSIGGRLAYDLRDIFGNPVRPISWDPDWRTPTVTAMAREMYESRDFSALPVFADALEEAGCQNEQILEHCRGPGPHVRGCHVVDLVLEKT